MQQSSPFAAGDPANSTRWRPGWASAVTIVLLAGCAGVFGLGLLMVITDLADHDDYLDGIGALIGGMIGLPGLLTGIPLVVFLVRRGGRVPFYLGLVLGIASIVAVYSVFRS